MKSKKEDVKEYIENAYIDIFYRDPHSRYHCWRFSFNSNEARKSKYIKRKRLQRRLLKPSWFKIDSSHILCNSDNWQYLWRDLHYNKIMPKRKESLSWYLRHLKQSKFAGFT